MWIGFSSSFENLNWCQKVGTTPSLKIFSLSSISMKILPKISMIHWKSTVPTYFLSLRSWNLDQSIQRSVFASIWAPLFLHCFANCILPPVLLNRGSNILPSAIILRNIFEHWYPTRPLKFRTKRPHLHLISPVSFSLYSSISLRKSNVSSSLEGPVLRFSPGATFR